MGHPVGADAVPRWVGVVLLVAVAGCAPSSDTGDASPTAASDTASEGHAVSYAPTEDSVPLPTPTTSGAEAYLEDSALRVLRGDGRFDTFVGIIEQGIVGRALPLWSDPFHDATIFAPTDAAFRSVDAALLEAMLDDRILPRIVTNHVFPEPLRLAELDHEQVLQTMGVEVEVCKEGGTVTVSGAEITEADVEAGVTVIHVLDELILPCNDAYLQDVLGPDFGHHCRS